MRAIPIACVLCCTFLLVPAASAQLSRQDQAAALKMVEGEVFMRLDAPCIYGAKTAAGLWFDPLLQVSPTGKTLLPIPKLSKRQFIYWGSGPNDPVGYGTIRVRGDTVYVWLEGRKPVANEFVVAFVGIKTIDDFKAAYERTFSPVPLEQAHREWPVSIRDAIRTKVVIEGMTQEQAFCVLGEPASVESTVENGVPVEVWHPRQENGTKQPYHNMKPKRTGFPAVVKFVDGKVVAIEKAGVKRR